MHQPSRGPESTRPKAEGLTSMVPSERPAEPRRDVDATLGGLLAVAVAAVAADSGAIYLLDPEQGDLRLATGIGLPDSAVGHRLAPGEGLVGRVAAERRSVASSDVAMDPRASRRRPDWDSDPPVRAFLGVPLRTGVVVSGVIELTSYRPDAFDASDRAHASVFADAAALLIEQTRLVAQPPPAALAGEPVPSAESPMGVATLGSDLRISSASSTFARMVGLPIEAIIGRPAIAVLPALGRPRARDSLLAALRGAPGHLGALRAEGEGGREETLSVTIIPLGDPARGIENVLLAVEDISERAMLEAELREQHAQALEARDRLRAVVEVVSHELRTPLTSVLGYARLLADRPDASDERRSHWVSLVLEKSRLMARLVDEVTELARLGSERITVTRAPADPGAEVERAVKDFASTCETHDVELEVEPGLPLVSLDRDRFAQVLTNLLSNAAKFWPDGGTIRVKVGADPDGVRVDVADRGPGIPEELSEKIFEAFYRIETEATRGVPGTGVGLSVSRGIVEAHGGRIWVDGNLGGGSVFRFTLPTSAEGGAEASDARLS